MIQKKAITITEKIVSGKFPVYNGTMVAKKRKFGISIQSERVALKKMHLKSLTEAEQTYIRQEIALHWFLSDVVGSEYLIKMLGWSMYQNKALIIMEKADDNLFHYIFDSEKQSPKVVHQFGVSIAKGVQILHNYSIAHRALKPQNVLVIMTSHIPQLKLCGFGSSRIETTLNLQGTFNYLAPEILIASSNGTIPTHKELISADIWGIGLIILFCLAKENPDVRGIDKLTNFMAKHCVGVPVAFETVIKKCLETNMNIRIGIDIVVKELLACSI